MQIHPEGENDVKAALDDVINGSQRRMPAASGAGSDHWVWLKGLVHSFREVGVICVPGQVRSRGIDSCWLNAQETECCVISP